MNSGRKMDEARVRKAVTIDANSIAEIYNHHIAIGGSTFDTQHWTEAEVSQLIGATTPHAWFVAEVHEQIVGWSSSRPHSTRHGYRFACETSIYLQPNATGCGIGDQLQTHLEQHCREAGIHHAVAKIISDNQRSISFHQRYGYEIVGIQKEIGYINGNWCDVTIMQKVFA